MGGRIIWVGAGEATGTVGMGISVGNGDGLAGAFNVLQPISAPIRRMKIPIWSVRIKRKRNHIVHHLIVESIVRDKTLRSMDFVPISAASAVRNG